MKNIFRTLLIIILALMVVHTLIYIAFGIALIPFPFDYDQAEGYELNNAVLLAQGECPYCNNDIFPFYGSGYPPFFHIVMMPFVKLFGPQFWYGRLIIFLSTFLTASAIAWAVQREEKHKLIAIIAGLAFLSSNYIYHIGPLLRQHLLMVMLETLAIVVVTNAFTQDTKGQKRRLFIAFTLLLLAGYTKQLSYATSIAVAIWVFIRNPRSAIQYSLGLIISAGVIFGLLMMATENQWWINIIVANQNPYITEQFTELMVQFLRLHWWLILPAGLLVIYELYLDKLSIYSIWFVISFANTAASGKWGAGDSYYATLLVSTCILSGIFLARTLNNNWSLPEKNYIAKTLMRFNIPHFQRILTFISLLLFIGYGITVFKIPTSGQIFEPIANALNVQPLPSWRYPLYDPAGWTVGYAVTGHLPTQEDYTNGWKIIDEVNKSEGLLMSEDASFSFRSGREVITNGVQLKNLWENNKYNPDELLSFIENQEFGLIILRAHLFPPPVLIAIETHYEIDKTIPMNGFEYELWRPIQNPSTN
jgi:hypothetical protein